MPAASTHGRHRRDHTRMPTASSMAMTDHVIAFVATASVTNQCGSATDSIYINTRNCGCYLQMPSAFTPNKDGVNDRFTSIYSCLPEEYGISIYNRWGEKVFESNNPGRPWDGTYKGQVVAPDTYIYYLRYRFEDDELQVSQGVVTVVQ